MTTARCSCFPKAVFANCPRLLIVLGCMILLVVGLAATPLHGQTYTDLHDFNCQVDGCHPSYPAILAQGRDGNLYGTMGQGGPTNFGTVFKITPGGVITTLHNFAITDGAVPLSGLTLGTDGDFYGTTYAGGLNNAGTIFKITPAGVLTTLHSFTNTDGFAVAPPILGPNGNYYGLTLGNTLIGTAYSITSSGTYKLLPTPLPGLSFAPLILASDGNFYGTTRSGGSFDSGTVFRMSAAGAIKIVYNFDGRVNGGGPAGPVVQGSDGFLYGTTTGGGLPSNPVGVVFRLSTGGAITVLHSFDAGDLTDGRSPYAGLVAATDGNFYGASSGSQGGLAQFGALFKISKSGSYSVLYRFDSTHGRSQSATSMQHTNGLLYGLPDSGGVSNGGVFYSLAVGISPFVSLTPSARIVGQTVEILGSGLTGTSSVSFHGTSAHFQFVSDGFLTATVPNGATSGTVTVTTPSRVLTSNKIFRVTPRILNFSPPSGPVGTMVTITGVSFTQTQGVGFGNHVPAAFTVNSDAQVTATVPAGAKTGPVGIQTLGGVAISSGTFTVTP